MLLLISSCNERSHNSDDNGARGPLISRAAWFCNPELGSKTGSENLGSGESACGELTGVFQRAPRPIWMMKS